MQQCIGSHAMSECMRTQLCTPQLHAAEVYLTCISLPSCTGKTYYEAVRHRYSLRSSRRCIPSCNMVIQILLVKSVTQTFLHSTSLTQHLLSIHVTPIDSMCILCSTLSSLHVLCQQQAPGVNNHTVCCNPANGSSI